MLAAGARGWQPRLRALGRGAAAGGGGPRWLLNDEGAAALVANRSSSPAVASASAFGAEGAALSSEGEGEPADERPCLGDVGAMVWRVEPCREEDCVSS